jgi:hypothetical protein
MASSIEKAQKYMYASMVNLSFKHYCGPGNEHDSKKLMELVERLDRKPKALYAGLS